MKKIIFGFAVVAMALGVAVAPAQAADSCSVIKALKGSLDASTYAVLEAALCGSTTSAGSYNFTSDLTLGSTGADVTALQNVLISKGYAIPAGATGYFGAQTQAAVAKWQAAAGITPAAGYVGPKSRAALNAMGGVSTNPNTPSTPSDLSGTDGSISDVDKLGSFNNEEVGDGEEGIEVLGADIEASNDGDIALKSVKVSFDPTGNTGSDNLDDYVDSVIVLLDGEEIGSADVDEFDESNAGVWSKTITVRNAVIEADETGELTVAVDAISNFDSGDISGDSWTVDVDSIRFEDGSGVVTTDNDTGDINDMNVEINFVSFSTAADTELKISTDSDSPEAGIVVVDDSNETDDVSLLKGKLKLEGTADVVLDQFPVTFTATANGGTADDVDDIASAVTLKIGGEEYSESVVISGSSLAGTITFDNLDFAIDAGDTVEFEVLADINDLDGSIFVAGATLKADVTASNRNLMDVENEEGDQLSDSSEKSGTATGEAQEFRVNGIQLTLVSTDTDATTGTSANDDVGLFTIRYKVTAIGDAVYLSSVVSTGVTFAVDKGGVATTSVTIVGALSNLTDTDLTSSAGNWLIEEGESETIELTVSVPISAVSGSGQYRTALTGVKWDTDEDASPDNTYSSNLDAFKTSYKVLN